MRISALGVTGRRVVDKAGRPGSLALGVPAGLSTGCRRSLGCAAHADVFASDFDGVVVDASRGFFMVGIAVLPFLVALPLIEEIVPEDKVVKKIHSGTHKVEC